MLKKIKLSIAGFIGIILLLIAIHVGIGYAFKETITIVPTKTERVSGKYLVFTDKGVFQDTDDYRFLKWNSSDVYAKINGRLGKPTVVTVTGFRIPLFSMYQNIIEVPTEKGKEKK